MLRSHQKVRQCPGCAFEPDCSGLHKSRVGRISVPWGKDKHQFVARKQSLKEPSGNHSSGYWIFVFVFVFL